MNGAQTPRRRPATAEEVARVAGVSVATVSRTFNRPTIVHPATRRKVLDVAERLQYSPSITARTLITGRSHVIGVILSDIEIPFFVSIARAIQDLARSGGYETLIGNSDEVPSRQDELLDAFEGRQVDGLIVSPASGSYERLAEVAGWIPVVLVDRLVPGLEVDAVLSTNFDAAKSATGHLLELGHRRIAYVTDELDKTSTQERLDGYFAVHREFGIEPDESLIWIVPYRPLACADRLVNRFRRERVTAVVASEGSITLGVLLAAPRAGLRIPQDISLIGFDELLWSAAAYVPVTVVSQDTEKIGTTAMRLLLDRIEGNAPRAARVHRIPTALIQRHSTRPPSGSLPGRTSDAEHGEGDGP